MSLTSECGHLEVVHLGERDHEGELVVLHVQLEEGAAADDLQRGQHDPRHVHVRDEDVARDLLFDIIIVIVSIFY